MSHPFKLNDGGRSTSKRSKQRSDCTVVALAIVTQIPYDDAYDLLAAGGRKSGQGVHFRKWLDSLKNEVAGHHFEWKSYPAVMGSRRMNPVDFCIQHPRGRYICKTAGHVFAVVDGVVQDTHQTYDERCIYASWCVTTI